MRIVPTTLIYLDTEFTSLGEPWPVQLISAGLARADGTPLFYAEVDDFDLNLTHDFTRDRVIPLLERGDKAMSYDCLRHGFFEAIASVGEPCALAADSDWDWLWTQMMAQGLVDANGPALLDDPSSLPLWPANLSPRMARVHFSVLSKPDKIASWAASREHFKHKLPHHALVDAVGNALCAKAAIENNPGRLASRPADFCAVFKQNANQLAWTSKPRAAPFGP